MSLLRRRSRTARQGVRDADHGSTKIFLGPKAFLPGGYTPKPTKWESGGRATYRGNIVVTNLARALVKAVLPPGLRLAKNSVAEELHPVIYLYGHVEDTGWIIKKKRRMKGANYQELMLLVPFVQKARTGTLWHNYVVRMYLDSNAMAVLIGNSHFAYGKESGTLREHEIARRRLEMTARDHLGVAKFRAETTRMPGWRPSAEFADISNNYQAMQTILAMPVVGWRASPRAFVCSYFELDYTHAEVAPLESAHQFLHPFVRGMSAWVGLPLSNVLNGAVAVRKLQWCIDEPPPPKCCFR